MDITDKVILIRPTRLYRDGMPPDELYEATRGVWKVSQRRCEEAEYAFVVYDGDVKEVYEIDRWDPAGTASYRYRPREEVNRPGRWEFVGRPAPGAYRRYVGMSIRQYLRRGNRNPIRYVNC